MKVLLFLLPLALFSGPEFQRCKVASMNKARIHPMSNEEIKKEIENNLYIIRECQNYPDIIKEAELYNEYLLFRYLRLPTVHIYDDKLLERCRRLQLPSI
jgi:hypothetical protein